jgi:hypothetical protein
MGGGYEAGGSKELLALPKAEMYQLKQVMFQQLPKYWCKPEAFTRGFPPVDGVVMKGIICQAQSVLWVVTMYLA